MLAILNPISDFIPEKEPERQFYYIDLLQSIVLEKERKLGRRLTYHISTFGCQMNFKDSEKLAGVLEQIGFVEVEDEKADFCLYNTCTVRENANLRVYGRLGYLGKLKSKNPDMIIAMCGCMMQEPQVVETIKKSYRFVDIIFGTHNIYKLAELLYQYFELNGYVEITDNSDCDHIESGTAKKAGDNSDANADDRIVSGTNNSRKAKNKKSTKHKTVIDIWKDTDKIVEELPSKLKSSFKAGVNIMFGCNNFCTFCIVPYVRGRERSRKPEDIINEIRDFVSKGVIEVMLLGQNVNSYGKNLDEPISFAELLRRIEQIEGLQRIRFMTPHPKDLSDELIEVMKNSKKICHHVHLPVQSGSTRLLKKMNRVYTKEDYMRLVDKIRRAMPDVALTSDIIVGFPGETEEDFEETLDIVRYSKYASVFTFIYSKRTGTPAAKFSDQIDDATVKNRFDRLLKVVNENSEAFAKGLEGKTMPVLVEERDRENKDGKNYLTGRLENNLLVHFEGEDELIGKIINVKLRECKGFYFLGEV